MPYYKVIFFLGKKKPYEKGFNLTYDILILSLHYLEA